MLINDRVYGEVEIIEPVLVELMQSRALQRLKGINQHGAHKYIQPGFNITRFEHCVGVAILLRKLGASIEEQIAGLIHDIPHTAFSHVIDFFFFSKEQEYHENFKEESIRDSDIPEILKRYGFDWRDFIDDKKFRLLETGLPDLCADRLDYLMRDTMAQNNGKIFNKIFPKLVVENNEIIAKDREGAAEIGNAYLLMSKVLWSHPRTVAGYQVLADCLKLAYENKEISRQDFFKNDEEVLKKLKASDNPEIQKRIKLMNLDFSINLDSERFDFKQGPKLRFVDPKIAADMGNMKRLSEVDSDFKKAIEDYKEKHKNAFFIKVDGL